MSFISRIFTGTATSHSFDTKEPVPAEYAKLLEFIERLKADEAYRTIAGSPCEAFSV